MKKQQQWTFLFKILFSSSKTPPLINSSTSSYNIARLFCSTTNTSLFSAVKKKNLPLLIVPYYDDDQETKQRYSSVCEDTIGFTCLFDDDFDLQKKKKKALVHKMYLPEIADRRICGSSEGWLITIHENTQVQLLNPITRVLFNLPPLITSFPGFVGKLDFEKDNYKGLCYLLHKENRSSRFYGGRYVSDSSSDYYRSLEGYDSHYFRDHFFKKVVTSTTTTDDALLPTVVIMAIYGNAMKLAFCRPFGNNADEKNKWIGCLQGDGGDYNDVTFYKGNFYAVSMSGDVVVVKGLDGPSPFVETIIERGNDLYRYSNYLVESSTSSSSTTEGGDGDLLKVMRLIKLPYKKKKKEGCHPYRTTRFKVMKLDFNNGGPASFVEVTNLGEDCALFIGYNHSFSFSASKIPGCRGNCIYFTDNNMVEFYKFEGHDMGVYNLEDGSIEKLNYETTGSFIPPPIWYVPN